MTRRVFTLAFAFTIGAAFAAVRPDAASAQLPEEFTNLQVLPEDIGTRELIGYMRGFSLGTGYRCSGCHVGEEGQPFSEYDFASDEKETEFAKVYREAFIEAYGDDIDALRRDEKTNVGVILRAIQTGVDIVPELQKQLHLQWATLKARQQSD